ncbi:MAG: hypothetical protein AAF721_40770 [Myxococcota bacterium]
MRLSFAFALACFAPATAQAAFGPEPEPTSSKAPSSVEDTPTEQPEGAESEVPDEDAPQPMSSKAPESAADLPAREEEPGADEPSSEPVTLSSERDKGDMRSDRRKWKGADSAFRRHGVGARGGITVIPSWVLSRWFATHTNALCRGDAIGNFAKERGIVQQDGCNFYVGGEYIYRFNRILDLVTSVGYQRVAVPPGLWLQDADYDPSRPETLGSADYTEIELGFVFIELDAIARVPIVVNENVEFSIGGGGGLGLGILFGNIHQTALGSAPAGFTAEGGRSPSCNTLDDFTDHTRCTPRYDVLEDPDMSPPDESQLQSPNADLFARCSKGRCSESDLRAFGYRNRQGGAPPVIPVLNLLLNARVILKDTVGIGVTGGFQTGFYFGGNFQYFFGKPKQDDLGSGPASASKRKRKRRLTLQRGARF